MDPAILALGHSLPLSEIVGISRTIRHARIFRKDVLVPAKAVSGFKAHIEAANGRNAQPGLTMRMHRSLAAL